MKGLKRPLFFAVLVLTVSSCSFIDNLLGKKGGAPTAENPGQFSTATGLRYNDEEKPSFQVTEFEGQPDAPNMRFIEGGRAVMGSFEEDVMSSRDNVERTISVASFYMDETEIANVHWLEYLDYLERDSAQNPAVLEAALPDTTVWVGKLAFNDPYVAHYLRYPGFRFFPVVGVSWRQANAYSKWRTAAVNMQLAEQVGENVANVPAGGRIPLESGFVIPDYRLPTEAEWEYAAQALIGTQWLEELQTHQRIYPWDGHALRNPYGKQMGLFLANFKRGRGDYAGIAGRLNDGALITNYIYEFPPNDYGLYNMAGNVSEWVMDVYRPLSYQDVDDLNPMRRDGFLDDMNNYNSNEETDPETFTSLVTDRARVYKGGSWKDVAYWMSPGTRRYLDEDSSTATIGFRCAMISAGTSH
jgi:gliding motility-associated lipoprotein GldJ